MSAPRDPRMVMLRDIIASALDLPSDGIGCVYILVDRKPDGGARVQMATIGLNEIGVQLALQDAVQMAGRPADVRTTIERKEPS